MNIYLKQPSVRYILPASTITVLILAFIYAHFEKQNEANTPNKNKVVVEQTASMSHHLQFVKLGDSGLNIKAPKQFAPRGVAYVNANDGLPDLEGRRYELTDNGVKVSVEYLQTKTGKLNLQDVTQHLQTMLSRMPGAHATAMQHVPVQVMGVEGIDFEARYNLPPFNKQIIYRVQAFSQQSKLWIITASYKNCDDGGQTLVTHMLDSLQINTS